MPDASDGEAAERAREPCARLLPRRPVRGELGDHRVVEHGDLGALDHARVDAYATLFRRRAEGLQPPDGGREIALRPLRIDARLDGPAVEADILLAEGERLACRHTQHLLHEVQPGDHLRHRMFHLEAGVHLQEVEIALTVHDELDRAGRAVVDGAGERHGAGAHFLAERLVDERARAFLDHLLVAALDRAFALAEMDGIAMRIGQHLDLDMAWLLDIFLDENAAVAESAYGLVHGGAEDLPELAVGAGDAHALATAAGRGLDHDRVADPARAGDSPLGVRDFAGVARHDGNARPLRKPLALDLVAHGGDGGRAGPDEHQPRRLDGLDEARILGEEAEARMDRLRAGVERRADDALTVQIAFRRRGPADGDRLVGHAHMQGIGVGLGIDGHRADPEAPRGPGDPAGDLAPVGDQDPAERRRPGGHGFRRLRPR